MHWGGGGGTFHAISFQRAWGSQRSYAARETRRLALALPADNRDAGAFLAFQRHQQKVRASPLPHSPFPSRHRQHCPGRKASSIRTRFLLVTAADTACARTRVLSCPHEEPQLSVPEERDPARQADGRVRHRCPDPAPCHLTAELWRSCCHMFPGPGGPASLGRALSRGPQACR